MSKVVERFLSYVAYDTKSDAETGVTPSTPGQMVLANKLVEELKEIGMSDVTIDENGYVMATLPANTNKEIPTIGFIAHMDTAPDYSGANVNPQFVENYDGGDIKLNETTVLSPKDFPELKDYIGKTLITTDGNSLLGADDKAGIAEIITAMEYLIKNPEIKHGTIRVGFTPDEEIGAGADHFDVEKFNADFAYTLDGGGIGEIEYENFNAASAKIVINGRNVHPGSAKNKMINSQFIGMELNSMLPANERPEHTEGYEGFYMLNGFSGSVERTEMSYIIRDFFKDSFEAKKANIIRIAEEVNKKYGEGTVEITVKDSYYNMKEKVEPVMHVVDTAVEAMKALDIVPKVVPIRGGTDGARLSYMGLPTPNLFAGGHNFHGKFEFVPTESIEKAVELVVKIIELYTNK
ncbi:peptidase T [Clostridium sp. UBA4548]|uniref:peptidase T n=1 Tax=Clostridium sp. UBA4548 TaxID=1946361 RepID=UPI0025C55B45|nr:peptidase T [Clostridium sp. UBA4548]